MVKSIRMWHWGQSLSSMVVLWSVPGQSLTEEDREAVWDEISDEVSALLQGQHELTASAVMPFDAASTITIEQQR